MIRRAWLFGLSALMVVCSPALAETDAESKAAAEILFREGMTAFDAGRYAEACPKLEGAVTLTKGEALGGILSLAHCYERQGRVASAWGLYKEVMAKAGAAGQTARQTEAAEREAALRSKLHYVTLHVPAELPEDPGARILRQGNLLPRELWRSRIPVDPGPVTFEIRAPHKRSSTKTIQVPEGPGETPIEFEPLADDAVTTASPLEHVTPGKPGAPSHPKEVWTGLRIGGAVIGGLGALGMVAGAVIGATAKNHYDQAVSNAANCSPRSLGGFVCTDTAPADRARSLGNVGTGVFVAGAGALVGGALLVIFAPSKRETAVLPSVNVGRGGGELTWAMPF